MRQLTALLFLAVLAPPAHAQSEDALRSAFEGRSVRVKIDMPGASSGIDVRPDSPRPIDLAQHASRLKSFGVAYRAGDVALVTKVHITGDHIEFQLGGGGFGTMGDDASTSVSAPVAPKTQREKDLEHDIKNVTDAGQKKKMQDELDRLRNDRRREDARNEARAKETQAIKEANVRQRRLDGGSRFNIRYTKTVPTAAMTPESVMAALGEYLDFSAAAPAPVGINSLHKGMLLSEADAVLGRPESITTRNEGTLVVSTSTYRDGRRIITLEFVEGVLIRYRVTEQ